MTRPSFVLEQAHWQQGRPHIAGLDEAGMGALAGPVIAAAVIFPKFPSPQMRGGLGWGDNEDGVVIKDSKLLTPLQREKAAVWIKKHALAWSIGASSVAEIDRLNVRAASHLAFKRAIQKLAHQPDLLLIDGNPLDLKINIKTLNIVKGDQVSYSMAAASILAKTFRDALMTKLSRQHPEYNFDVHKGYGTSQHLAALKKHGPCSRHRFSYAPVRACQTSR